MKCLDPTTLPNMENFIYFSVSSYFDPFSNINFIAGYPQAGNDYNRWWGVKNPNAVAPDIGKHKHPFWKYPGNWKGGK